MKLLENTNALPFEAQNHCKLRLEEQKDIHDRYANGESIEDIHESYPFVSDAAIRYWAFNRERDLERRKNSPSYATSGGSCTASKNYLEDLKQRRIDNGLFTPSPFGAGAHSLTGIKLTKEQKEEIISLYQTKQHTERSIAEKLNLPVTIVRSVFQSKQYKDHYRSALKSKQQDKTDLVHYIYNLYLQGYSYEGIAEITDYAPKYIQAIITVAKNPSKYLDKNLNHIAKRFINDKEEII